jgi:hypothetical protein
MPEQGGMDRDFRRDYTDARNSSTTPNDDRHSWRSVAKVEVAQRQGFSGRITNKVAMRSKSGLPRGFKEED